MLRFSRPTVCCAAGLVLVAATGCSRDPIEPTSASSLEVTSPFDSIVAVGKTLLLAWTVKGSNGFVTCCVPIVWRSSNPAALAVSEGRVTGVAPGVATISATSGSAKDSLRMRAVQADLATIDVLAWDPYASALAQALSPGTRDAVALAFGWCKSGTPLGAVVTIMQCVTGVTAAAVTATDPSDRVLLATLQLYTDETQRRLGL